MWWDLALVLSIDMIFEVKVNVSFLENSILNYNYRMFHSTIMLWIQNTSRIEYNKVIYVAGRKHIIILESPCILPVKVYKSTILNLPESQVQRWIAVGEMPKFSTYNEQYTHSLSVVDNPIHPSTLSNLTRQYAFQY